MAKKITEYPQIEALFDDDMLFVNQGNALKQIKKTDLGIDKIEGVAYIDKEDTEEVEDARYLFKSDVIDSLNSTEIDKPLSANMGRELNDKLSNSELTTLVTGIKYRKTTSNFCELFIDGTFTATANTYINVGTLPVGYRPVATLYSRGATKNTWIAIDDNGNILINSDTSGSQGFYCHVVFGI